MWGGEGGVLGQYHTSCKQLWHMLLILFTKRARRVCVSRACGDGRSPPVCFMILVQTIIQCLVRLSVRLSVHPPVCPSARPPVGTSVRRYTPTGERGRSTCKRRRRLEWRRCPYGPGKARRYITDFCFCWGNASFTLGEACIQVRLFVVEKKSK